MPREVIKGVNGMYDLHIGWSEETVQIGVVTEDKTPLLDMLEDYTDANGVWSTLDRESLDRLILTLNRVRVKAYLG